MKTMKRPCSCGCVDKCRLCWLARFDGRYQKLWGLPVTADDFGARRPARPPKPEREPACLRRGPPTGEVVECPSCSGRVRLKLLACEIHGKCTPAKALPGVATCKTCPDRLPPGTGPFTGPVTRHLLYHVYPAKGNGVWQRRLDFLLPRLPLFNGRRLFGVAVDGATDPAEHVERHLAGAGCELAVFDNHPVLQEAHTFVPLFERVVTDDPNHVAFRGHAKGVSRPVNDGVSVHEWADIAEEVSLDFWPLVRRGLEQYPVTGPFLKLGHGFGRSSSDFHYAGSYYWVRLAALAGRPWRQVDRVRWGGESAPGVWFDPPEAGCLFHPGRVGRMNLYDLNFLRAVVRPALERFRGEHDHDRTRLV